MLSADIPCNGEECAIHEPRTLQAAPGMWFEYVKPPCVNQAFYDNAQTIRRRSRWRGGYLCGNPEALDGAVICCNSSRTDYWRDTEDWRQELFAGERVPLSTAIERCTSGEGSNNLGRNLCIDPYAPDEDCSDEVQGGCDSGNIFYWTQESCELTVKINLEGRIALVHKHGVTDRSQSETYRMLRRWVLGL